MNHPVPTGPPNSSRSNAGTRWGDYQIELVIGHLLRCGVMLSAAVVFFGGCIYISRHAHQPANYRIFRGEPSEFRTIPGILQSIRDGRGRGWIQLGLLLLIATPIARVAFCIAGFAMERDRLYVLFTVIVLTVLLYSLIGSGLTF
jgi:uncharacterized membrane protein